MNRRIWMLVCAGHAAAFAASPGVPTTLPAFPGAEGFGALARGGRGGKAVYVTSLRDYNPGIGEPVISGSLRWAVERQRGPRTILFRTGGTIVLKADLKLTGEPGSYVTIAGQSAPGDGIQIAGRTLMIGDGAHDVVVRYLRVRPGVTPIDRWKRPAKPGQPMYLEKWDTDALTIYGFRSKVHDVIVDHCSLEWAIDENANVWDAAERITFQYCIFAEGSSFGHYGHPEVYPYSHSLGFLAGGAVGAGSDEYLTLHHNLFMSNLARNPQLTCGGCTVDFVNNVLYNCGAYGLQIAGNGKGRAPRVNVVGNVYRFGPDDNRRRRMVWLKVDGADAAEDASVYVRDNLDAFRGDSAVDDWEVVFDDSNSFRRPGSGEYARLARKRRAAPWPTPGIPVTVEPAAGVFSHVAAEAGATFPRRDPVDARLAGQLATGRGRLGFGTQDQYDRHPQLAAGSGPADSDEDGIPDAWEQAHGLDPRRPDDAAAPGEDGYTHLESYLNGLAAASRPSR